jgi:hypothetical protein
MLNNCLFTLVFSHNFFCVYKPPEAYTQNSLDAFYPNTCKSNYVIGSHFNHIYVKKSDWRFSFVDSMASLLLNTKVTFLNNLNNLVM